ncbi:MAG: mechanosensitive ion channel family protein [Cyanomargarita calcarea GSE-NOS-MK-12-04C]|jgi:small-conductance mechanosensitive channel|uniref:Mechanosensitive ion channel family protein n=1 Tax=Cyanomargarita calcarea GSE-NOS-MK-12-04C TaxID=2839659 RepID=A0A951UTP7_9CYAN|nr:mechanosensitive ion channel family protein [Cyanomargarita calcarea GSE-NOS-MK-12-04C]
MTQWILPLAFILAGLLAGIIGEKIIFQRLKNFVINKQIPGSEIIFQSLHRMTFIWFAIAGFSGAILSYEVKADIATILHKIVTIIFLFSVTVVCARLTGGFITLVTQRRKGVSTSLISNVAKGAVLILGTLILLQTVGVQITPVLTTLGVGGLAVGLALQSTLANLFSGFYLIISKQVRAGDYIKLETGEEGYVTDITWRDTNIKELSNNIIVVPNSKLGSAIFTNYNLPVKEITLSINLGVDYDSDLDIVERVTVEVAKEVMQEISPELIQTEPFLRYRNFGDFSIDFTVFLRVNEFFDQRIARHIFIKKLHKRYQQEGIKIPFPIREILMQENGIKNGSLSVD